jgi:hypothetical protein
MDKSSEDHVEAISLSTQSWNPVLDEELTWRPGGACRWKGETVGWEDREWYVESKHLQGCSPRLCRLRTDGLAPQGSIECTDRMPVLWAQ